MARSNAKAPDNIYTVLLLVSFGVALASLVFVAFKCYAHYETLINIP